MCTKEYKRNKFPRIAMFVNASETPLRGFQNYVSMC
jgi:hypothetical protein